MTMRNGITRVFVVAGFVVAVLVGLGAPLFAADKVTELKAFYREGQTFITWKELGDVQKENYRVYESGKKIGAADLKDATLVATVPEGSCVFAGEIKHHFLQDKTKAQGYGQRFCIEDNVKNDPEKMLPVGTGLFVNTTHKDGQYYYAVVPEVGGKEQPELMAALDAALDEKVMLPGAVIQWKHTEGTAAVYCHWMDYAKWDPFCEGYAYNFGVAVPKGYDGNEPLPVMYYGHGMSGGYSCSDSAPYVKAVWVWHGDKTGSWFFGVMNRDKTKVINYVEKRVRWSFEWLKAGRPNQFFKIDPRFVQAQGSSMGGTMVNAFMLRMGDIFTAGVSSVGATIHSRNGNWVNQAARLWGTVAQNLPTEDGTGVWDHQDYGKWSLAHVEQETGLLLMANRKRDTSVVFEPVPDFYDAMQKSKRPFVARWDNGGHDWQPECSCKNARWSAYQLPIDETIPAFTNASNNGDPRKDLKGTINGNLEWSASGNNFDKAGKADDIIDTDAEYGMNVRSLTEPATVDITPRRVQKFKIEKGKSYAWENIDFSDPANPKSVAKGTVKPDEHGLLTVEKFQVGKAGLGNRLVIKPAE